jgi:hypothetical protein
MAASLYRLVGREHHSTSVESKQQETVPAAVEAPLEEQLNVVEENQTSVIATSSEVEPVIIEQQAVQVEPPAPPKQIWDLSMSRAQLAKIALSLGLVFTDKSTKSEIIALLESSSKA